VLRRRVPAVRVERPSRPYHARACGRRRARHLDRRPGRQSPAAEFCHGRRWANRTKLAQSLIVAVMAKKPATAKITATLARPLNGAMTNAAPSARGATRDWRVIVLACASVSVR